MNASRVFAEPKSTMATNKSKRPASASSSSTPSTSSRRIAVIGAGMAGIACARTLMQAGHDVHVYERLPQAGGRMRSVNGPFGSFDIGAQYFTVRDTRFQQALDTVPGLRRAWSVSAVRNIDANGRQAGRATAPKESHWVGTPDMQALPLAWAAPLWDADRLHLGQRVARLEHCLQAGQKSQQTSASWTLHISTEDHGDQTQTGFDAVVLAVPAPVASALLQDVPQAQSLLPSLAKVQMDPCWAITLAYPMAAQAGLSTLGPQWNAARAKHDRIAWVARESSKPTRAQTERWTVLASPQWSKEHAQDDSTRVLGKQQKAFGELTGIRVAPRHAGAYLWPHAQTTTALGSSHVWNEQARLGLCGDWCLGRRVEDAFISGLEMALAVV